MRRRVNVCEAPKGGGSWEGEITLPGNVSDSTVALAGEVLEVEIGDEPTNHVLLYFHSREEAMRLARRILEVGCGAIDVHAEVSVRFGDDDWAFECDTDALPLMVQSDEESDDDPGPDEETDE